MLIQSVWLHKKKELVPQLQGDTLAPSLAPAFINNRRIWVINAYRVRYYNSIYGRVRAHTATTTRPEVSEQIWE